MLYIVYLGEHSGNINAQEIENQHNSYLYSLTDDQEGIDNNNNSKDRRRSFVHSYKNIINGFSALLTPEEAAKLSETAGVVSVFESQVRELKLQTTRSWDFIDLLEANGDRSKSITRRTIKDHS